PPDHLPPVVNAPGASPPAAAPPPGRTRLRAPPDPNTATRRRSTGIPRAAAAHGSALGPIPPPRAGARSTGSPRRRCYSSSPANLVLLGQPCRPSSPTAARRPPPMAPDPPPAFSHSPTQSTVVRGTEAGRYPVHLQAAAVGCATSSTRWLPHVSTTGEPVCQKNVRRDAAPAAELLPPLGSVRSSTPPPSPSTCLCSYSAAVWSVFI
uniref:Uncharacterized protein n=2 Tax=Triticinae TaxID=1648030 RepID=A0A453P929_AEGTS